MIISGEIKKSNILFCGKTTNKKIVDGTIDKAETVYKKELVFADRFEFPAIGNEQILYIAENENAIFIFNEDTNTYICISRDYNQIEGIQCKLKEF